MRLLLAAIGWMLAIASALLFLGETKAGPAQVRGRVDCVLQRVLAACCSDLVWREVGSGARAQVGRHGLHVEAGVKGYLKSKG